MLLSLVPVCPSFFGSGKKLLVCHALMVAPLLLPLPSLCSFVNSSESAHAAYPIEQPRQPVAVAIVSSRRPHMRFKGFWILLCDFFRALAQFQGAQECIRDHMLPPRGQSLSTVTIQYSTAVTQWMLAAPHFTCLEEMEGWVNLPACSGNRT